MWRCTASRNAPWPRPRTTAAPAPAPSSKWGWVAARPSEPAWTPTPPRRRSRRCATGWGAHGAEVRSVGRLGLGHQIRPLLQFGCDVFDDLAAESHLRRELHAPVRQHAGIHRAHAQGALEQGHLLAGLEVPGIHLGTHRALFGN